MDIVNKLIAESNSVQTYYTEFILKLNKNNNDLFCFFEGRDDNKYYGIRIRNYTERNYDFVCCDGKENVLDLESLLSSKEEYKNLDLLYFVDMDYSAKIENPKIYTVPSYAIENQYTYESSLKSILETEFSLSDTHSDYTRVLDLFKDLQDNFNNKTLLLNSWLACQSDLREQNNPKNYLNIDNTVSSYFNNPVKTNLVHLKDLSDLDSKDKIESLFSNAPKIDNEILQSKLDYFQQANKNCVFRGKFQFAFFISFLSRLKEEICKKDSTLFDTKHKCTLRFEYSTALTTLSSYASTPECLTEYLKSKRKNVA